ncbi:MAG: DMT family transporter, partial [Bacteroidales bacterium]
MGNNGNGYTIVLYNLLAILIVMIWGASFVATKVLLNVGLEPLMIYLLRFSIAYIVISMFRFKRLWADSVRDELLFMICGVTGGVLYYVSENMALDYTYVANVSLIVSLTPIFTAMFISLFYRADRVGGLFFVGSLIAIAGVGVVVLSDADGKVGFNLIGDLLSLIAAISWGVYSLILRGLIVKYNADFVTRKTLFYGVV